MRAVFEPEQKEIKSMTLDQMIYKDGMGHSKNTSELKEKIYKMKERIDRFGDNEIKNI